jgi:hypothetical protein
MFTVRGLYPKTYPHISKVFDSLDTHHCRTYCAALKAANWAGLALMDIPTATKGADHAVGYYSDATG